MNHRPTLYTIALTDIPLTASTQPFMMISIDLTYRFHYHASLRLASRRRSHRTRHSPFR
ncbi:hypothetical protein [Geitlerinema sp. P-1104]|uniref:hypothetical protein n=1 Tax=Geitlerinema sp. P-1104 TaxID=2546230 RepID=UPI001476E9BE|nr:hypothetical protein [Geitlerinema sp. P-1104]